MDKKWIAIICIVILLVVGLIVSFDFANQETEIKIGSSTFQLPDGYHAGNSDKNITNLTNGEYEIYIENFDGKNVQKQINKYKDYSEKNNHTVKISNFTVGKTLVYKSNINASNAVHYWFIKNNNTYSIASWDDNPEIDSIATKFIESCN